ncbi:DUF983 domain-containing protein [Cellulophaga sp. E16_2]|uniref:DUF983 domain-containing protein n=1 Tax=Cellulophaga algicola (strain DSM 14237 / IC166 / ACAM 630) TaxID=688270 RepID=E6X3P1_CELAD|nr:MULTISPECIES: DUF983 domain-containing protein [Cellulophaga]ADV48194.1 hypothetical protein Celal_0867 [Cellulophaga algicola DSM 14237]MBO0590619.1 DUF983 domain-containing protein [Cellulophaga sp. E16_2]
MNIFKGTKLYSIFTGTCPVCQQESMYKEANPFKIMDTLKMNERCSHCNTKYKIEPSFFFGAMYVSYPIGIGFAAIAFVLSYLVFKIDILPTFYIICVIMLFMLPVILRLSRNIWINFFKHYQKQTNLNA